MARGGSRGWSPRPGRGGAGAGAVFVPAGLVLSYEYFKGRGGGRRNARVEWGGRRPPRGARDPAGRRCRRRRTERASTRPRAFDADLQINIAPGTVSLSRRALARVCVCVCGRSRTRPPP